VRFVQRLISIRKAHVVLRAERFYVPSEIEWVGPFGQPPDWQGPENRVGCLIHSDVATLALLFNSAAEACVFTLPGEPTRVWQVCIDTARPSPDDAPDPPSAPLIHEAVAMRVAPHALLVLRALPG
jgi:glycogen operon protein